MYHAKLWDEDKWNIHSGYNSSKYSSTSKDDKKEDKKYHEQKYGSEGKDVSSDYIKKDELKEKEDKKADEIFGSHDEEKKEELKEEDIPFRAAKQVFSESIREPAKIDKKQEVNSIEEAIKKAIEEEKKVIIMGN